MTLKKTILSLFVLSSLQVHAGSNALVDVYGQYLNEDWPGQIKNDLQFREDAEREAKILAQSKAPERKTDMYGGLIEEKSLPPAKFFRIEKTDGRFWLITPAGNRFFMIGVDAIRHSENGYSTPVTSGDSPRDVFTELPDQKNFPEAWQRGKINFLTANLKRKYGSDFEDKWKEIALKRLKDWGFNSTAQWGWGCSIGLPYIEDMHIKDIKRIGKYRSVDPFAPDFRDCVRKTMAAIRKECITDPMLLGYSIENENGWSPDFIGEIMQFTNGKCYAKKEFLKFLHANRNSEIGKLNSLFGTKAQSLEELEFQSLSTEKIPAEELKNFIYQASVFYHKTLAEELKNIDPDHLFFAASHCNMETTDWIAGSVNYIDAIALHEYTLMSHWESLFKQFEKFNKPVLMLEFSFVEAKRGMPMYNPIATVSSQRMRGLAYRVYTEHMASHPLIAGFGWFIYYDQPVTMRSLPNGESYNFGLVNQCDQPYYDMIEEMKLSNARLFDVHRGTVEPFTSTEYSQILDRKELLTNAIPDSISPIAVVDNTNPQYFDREKFRLKLNERVKPELGFHQIAAWEINDKLKQVAFKCFIWKEASSQNPSDYFKIEESSDGKSYSDVQSIFVRDNPGEFNKFMMIPRSLKKESRFIRLSINVSDSSKSWIPQCVPLMEYVK